MIATNSGGYQGIGFALPLNMAVKSYNQIIQSGRVSRGSIGISFPRDEQQMTSTLKALGFHNGVIVESVTPGGPSEKAGLKSDDVLLTLNGKPIKDGNDLVSQVSEMSSGTSVTIGFDRDGKKLEKQVNIQDREKVFKDDPRVARNRRDEMTEPDEKAQTTARFGIGIRALTDEQRKELQFDQPGGVMVTVVEEGSFAEEIGIKERDIVVSINRQPVASFDDVKKVQGHLKSGDAVAFKVMRPTGAQGGAALGWGVPLRHAAEGVDVLTNVREGPPATGGFRVFGGGLRGRARGLRRRAAGAGCRRDRRRRSGGPSGGRTACARRGWCRRGG